MGELDKLCQDGVVAQLTGTRRIPVLDGSETLMKLNVSQASGRLSEELQTSERLRDQGRDYTRTDKV